MSNAVPDRLEDLAEELLPWTSTMPSIKFYLYGSRVRGDHRHDRDVDICIDTDDADWNDRLTLHVGETGEFELPQKYKNLVRDQSKRWPKLRDTIRAAPVIYRKCNIVCVSLPPAPKGQVSN